MKKHVHNFSDDTKMNTHVLSNQNQVEYHTTQRSHFAPEVTTVLNGVNDNVCLHPSLN